MTNEILFYIGIIVPTTITLVVFVVFLCCLRRYRVRRKVMTRVYAPHAKGWPAAKEISPPRSTASSATYGSTLYDALDVSLSRLTTAQVHALGDEPEHLQLAVVSSNNDSAAAAARQNEMGDGKKRPYSRSSTDSDDSGFRSSRSAQNLLKCDVVGRKNRPKLPLPNPTTAYREAPILRGLEGSFGEDAAERPDWYAGQHYMVTSLAYLESDARDRREFEDSYSCRWWDRSGDPDCAAPLQTNPAFSSRQSPIISPAMVSIPMYNLGPQRASIDRGWLGRASTTFVLGDSLDLRLPVYSVV